jgi:hypothetical protein
MLVVTAEDAPEPEPEHPPSSSCCRLSASFLLLLRSSNFAATALMSGIPAGRDHPDCFAFAVSSSSPDSKGRLLFVAGHGS